MPAFEAILLLEEMLKNEELELFKHQQLLYASSLPLYINSKELPPEPKPPVWLRDYDG